MKYHPDQNPGDETVVAKFNEVTEAYEVLRDPQKRQVYDRYGHEGLANGGPGGCRAASTSPTSSATCSADFFGGGGAAAAAAGPRRGADIQAVLDIDLLEAATGVKKSVHRSRRGATARPAAAAGRSRARRPTRASAARARARSTSRPAGCSPFQQACRGVRRPRAWSSPTRARPAAGSAASRPRETVDHRHARRAWTRGNGSRSRATGTRASRARRAATWNSSSASASTSSSSATGTT